MDGEIEGDLARVLSCMGTNDKEVLIRQFQQVLGDQSLTPEACHFFLDMSSWNLQTALGNYYDFGAANNVSGVFDAAALHMQVVNDVTVGEGEAIPPNTPFTKTWRVRNTGLVDWPVGTLITFIEGAKLSVQNELAVANISPGEEYDICVPMISPVSAGVYQSRWHLTTPQGVPFGDSIWCIMTVDLNGILDITQQLASAPLVDRTHAAFFGMPALPTNNTVSSSVTSMADAFRMECSRSDECMDEDIDLPQPNNQICLPQTHGRSVHGRVHQTTPISISPCEENMDGCDPNPPPCTPCTPPADQSPSVPRFK